MAPPKGMAMASESFKLIRRKSSVSDLTPELTRKALMETFREVDEDGSGFVDKGELTRVLSTIGVHMDNPLEDVDAIFEAMDMDGDGTIDTQEFCSRFEPAIKRCGSQALGKMDLDSIMKETFDKMLEDARDQRAFVNRSFMQARDDCASQLEKETLGNKWRMKIFDHFYTESAKGTEKRLEKLRENLYTASKGENEWLNEALQKDADFKREILKPDCLKVFTGAWLKRIDTEVKASITRRASVLSTQSVESDGAQPPADGFSRAPASDSFTRA
jgi:hypothetical protein